MVDACSAARLKGQFQAIPFFQSVWLFTTAPPHPLMWIWRPRPSFQSSTRPPPGSPDDELGSDTASITDVHIAPAIPAGVRGTGHESARGRTAAGAQDGAGRRAGIRADECAADGRGPAFAAGSRRPRRAPRRETALGEAEAQVGRNAERIAGLEIELANVQRTATELRTQLDQDTATAARREDSPARGRV